MPIIQRRSASNRTPADHSRRRASGLFSARSHAPRRRRRPAFTLLEVILALTILAGSVAVLSEVMSLASRHATAAQAETRAQMLARSVMNEMVVGLTDRAAQARQPLTTDDSTDWVYSVTLSTTAVSGLTAIEVLVEQDLEPQFSPVKYRLVRWVRGTSATDDAAAEAEDQADEDEATTTDDATTASRVGIGGARETRNA